MIVVIHFDKGKIMFLEKRQVPTMDCYKGCSVVLFNILLNLIWLLVKEFLQAITCFIPKIIKSVVQGVPIFITKKMVVEMFRLPKLGITKLVAKLTKGKDKERKKEREVAIYRKIASPEALADWERWKVSFLKGRYAIKLLTLI